MDRRRLPIGSRNRLLTPIEASGAPEQGDKAQVEGGPELPPPGRRSSGSSGPCAARRARSGRAAGTWSCRASRRSGSAPRRRSPTQGRDRSTAPDRGSSRSRGLTGWRRRRKFDLSLILGRGAYTTFRDVTHFQSTDQSEASKRCPHRPAIAFAPDRFLPLVRSDEGSDPQGALRGRGRHGPTAPARQPLETYLFRRKYAERCHRKVSMSYYRL